MMIYFAELQNVPTYDVKGHYLGRVVDLAINPSWNALKAASYLVQTRANQLLCITYEQIQSISVRAVQTNVPQAEIQCTTPDEGQIRIKKDVLDQQIIDINNRKVVRVIDVAFEIEPAEKHSGLRVLSVEVGWPAAMRRLFQGLMAKHTVRMLARPFPTKSIPWEFVSLIEPDPARRVKLRIAYQRLAELHPADIADILEELSHEEQKAVIESLDSETAAEAVSEIPTRMQVALLDSLSAGQAADIVEEMAPDEAADVLQELPPETSAKVLANMETEEANEVRELLGFEENSAGGFMTTELVVVPDHATVSTAIDCLRAYSGSLESVHAIYLVDPSEALTGTVGLAALLVADRNVALKDLSEGEAISVAFHADEKTVVNLFHKYNLLALPVVDDNGRLLGVVTADDVLELVIGH
jgi:magnesium transporter